MATEKIDQIIAFLGNILLTDREQFAPEAAKAALEFAKDDLPYLRQKFHNPPAVYSGIDDGDLGLGQWMAVCQYVIFEIVFNMNVADTIDFLKSVAFGPYDWTQATALEVLSRLYVEKRIDESILQQIESRLPEMRYETYLYWGTALRSRGKTDDRHNAILRDIKNEEFKEAINELEEIDEQ